MSNDWIDEEGFRANVGIILVDDAGKLLLGGRVGNKGWQFPQGGILDGEDPGDAMYRELHEEVGLAPDDVELLGSRRTGSLPSSRQVHSPPQQAAVHRSEAALVHAAAGCEVTTTALRSRRASRI